MSTHGWDGGCWIVLGRDCEPISSYHHHCEADAHATSIPLNLFVRRVPCGTEPVNGWHPVPEEANPCRIAEEGGRAFLAALDDITKEGNETRG